MWFLLVFAAALAIGLNRRLASRQQYALAIGAVGIVVLYAGLTTHAL